MSRSTICLAAWSQLGRWYNRHASPPCYAAAKSQSSQGRGKPALASGLATKAARQHLTAALAIQLTRLGSSHGAVESVKQSLAQLR